MNVGYGVNGSLESSVRVILIHRQKLLAYIYRREMIGKLDTFVRITMQELFFESAALLCLLSIRKEIKNLTKKED